MRAVLITLLLMLCFTGCEAAPQLPMKLTTQADLKAEVERVAAPLPPKKAEQFRDAVVRLAAREAIAKYAAEGDAAIDRAIVATFDGKTPDQVIAAAKAGRYR